jgi:hypothetical protein
MNFFDYLKSAWNAITTFITNPSTLLVAAIIFLVLGLIGLIPTIAKWKIYEKAGYPGWAIFVPYYKDYAFVRIAGLPWWCFPVKLIAEYAIPGIEIFTKTILNILVAIGFGKDIPFGFGLSFLPVIFYPILGFGKADYRYPKYLGADSLPVLQSMKSPELPKLVDNREPSVSDHTHVTNRIVLAIILILLGTWFVAVQQIPILKPFSNLNLAWPFYVIGAGTLLLVIGLLTGAPRMAIPASIVAGIGVILYYQNLTTPPDYLSWEFMWTLIPGFVGVGTILAGLLGDGFRYNVGHGLNLIVISAVLFLIFAAIFQRITILGSYGVAALLILLGLYVIAHGLLRPQKGG